MRKVLLAIDAGMSGGYAVNEGGESSRLEPWTSEADFLDELDNLRTVAVLENLQLEVWLEEVPPYVGRNIPSSASFKLGKNYGFLIGAVRASNFPLHFVRPTVWQTGLSGVRGVQGAAKKRALRDHAVRLYPETKGITLKTADAVLIYEYAKKQKGT